MYSFKINLFVRLQKAVYVNTEKQHVDKQK